MYTYVYICTVLDKDDSPVSPRSSTGNAGSRLGIADESRDASPLSRFRKMSGEEGLDPGEQNLLRSKSWSKGGDLRKIKKSVFNVHGWVRGWGDGWVWILEWVRVCV